MSSFPNTPNFDNLLLQSLMGRLQLRPSNNPLLSQSLEDLLFDAANNLSDDDENDENKSQLAKEESKLEKEIIRVILSGKTDSLKPNSGQAVTIGEHHICVGFHVEKGSDYRVWEWHGHIMLFDEENGYTPEYIYGNYFERLLAKARSGVEEVDSKEEEEEEEEEEEKEKVGNLGLRELIDGGDSSRGRILHRNMNVGSPRFTLNTFPYHCQITNNTASQFVSFVGKYVSLLSFKFIRLRFRCPDSVSSEILYRNLRDLIIFFYFEHT